MKKTLTILATIGIAGILTGCSSMEIKKEKFVENFNAFQNGFDRLSNIESTNKLTQQALAKYTLSVETSLNNNEGNIVNNEKTQELQEQILSNNASTEKSDQLHIEESGNDINNTAIPDETNLEEIKPISEPASEELTTKEIDEKTNSNEYFSDVEDNLSDLEIENEPAIDNAEDDEISTLYNLTDDVNNSCDEFCELKQQLTGAIIETEELIQKLQNKEIELTREQRMFINEQSMQLKNLGRQLSNITTELSISLSDLNQIMLDNGHNINDINLKYLVVLDNLINGNEMLQSSLNSINLINQMFNLKPALSGNNPNHILYGFKRNNEQPIFKNYKLDENGNLIEDSVPSELPVDNSEHDGEKVLEDDANIDTYQNKIMKTNIDAYYNNMNNIDTFFNTALLDNQFMYGNRGGFPYYNNMYYGAIPNMNNRINQSTNSVDNSKDTKHVENETTLDEQKKNPSSKKRIKLTKNIDTFKDENESTLKEKFNKMKSFFKFNSNFD